MQNFFNLIKHKVSLSFLRNKYFQVFLKFHYQVAIDRVVKKSKILNLDGLYIKGSYNYPHFELGISDIDFVVIGSKEAQSEFLKLIHKLSRFYPQLGDVDTFDKETFSLVIKYSDIRYRDFKNWKILIENSYSIQDEEEYLFFPLKYKIDQFSELHFQFEWLFKNLNSKRTKYNSLKIKRICHKILKILKWIESNDLCSFNHYKVDLNFHQNLETTVNKVLDTVANSEYLVSLDHRVHKKLGKSSVHFEKINNGYIIGDKKLLLSNQYVSDNGYYYTYPELLFRLFHSFGLITPDSLIETAGKLNIGILKATIWMRIYGQYLIGKSSEVLKNRHQEMADNIKLLENYDIKVLSPSKKLFKEDFFVTVNWGEDERRFRSFYQAQRMNKKIQNDYNHFHVEFSNSTENFNFLSGSVLKIEFTKENIGLWHKESLFNLAADYLFFADVFIFSDSDVYCKNPNWLKESFWLTRNTSAALVQCFSDVTDSLDQNYYYKSWVKGYLEGDEVFEAPGLCWGIRGDTLDRLGKLPDSLIDGSNDGLFIQELTKYSMGRSSSFEWFIKRVREFVEKEHVEYVDYSLIHINHGESRDYKNRGEYLSYFRFDHLNYYSKNKIGIYEALNHQAISALNLLKSGNIDSLSVEQRKELLLPPNYIKLTGRDSSFLECFNSLVQFDLGDKSFFIKNIDNSNPAKVKLTPLSTNIYSEEGFRLLYSIEGDYKDFDVSLICDNFNDPSIVNQYNNQRQNIKFIELCFNSWREKSEFSLELSFDIESESRVIVKEIVKERVHLTHGWNSIIDQSFDLSSSPLVKLDNSELLGESWYRVDLEFDLKKSHEICVSTINQYKRNLVNDRYFKVERDTVSFIFYKNKFAREVYFRFLSKVQLDGQVTIKLRKRSILDPI